MSTKYRVRLASGRTVGPLVLTQIVELFSKGHLKGNEDCQVFPIGDWKKINTFNSIVSQLNQKKQLKEVAGHEEDNRQDATVLKLNILNDLLKAKKKQDVAESPPLELVELDKEVVVKEIEVKEEAPEEAPKEAKLEENKKDAPTGFEFREFRFKREHEEMTELPSEVMESAEVETRPDYSHQTVALAPSINNKTSAPNETNHTSSESIGPDKTLDETLDKTLDKTIVFKPQVLPSEQTNLDKTIIVNPQNLNLLNDSKEIDDESEKESEKEVTSQSKQISTSEKTEFISLTTLMPDLKNEVQNAEIEMEEKLALILKKEKEEEEALQEIDDDEDEATITKMEAAKKKGMKPIVALAFLVILYFELFDDDEKKPEAFEPKKVTLSFPSAYEYEDEVKSTDAYEKGMEYYNLGTYIAKIHALLELKESLGHKFNGNNALGMLILLYAEIFENSSNKLHSAQSLHRMIQITRGRVLSDTNIALGTAIFHYKFGKPQAAVNILENFLRVKQPSVKMLSYYLSFLMNTGNFVQAKIVYDTLAKAPGKPLEAFIFMARFHEYNERFTEGKEVLEEGKKIYSNSVWLLLDYCEYLLREERIQELQQTLDKIKELRAEDSPHYFARYLEYMGMIAAYQKNIELASKFFKHALELHESDALRSKLAALEIGGGKGVEKLILESKVVQLLNKSKQAEKENKWESAFKFAIQASDMMDGYIPAELHLARIQIKRGYYESAITILQTLKNLHYLDPEINFHLITGLIDAHKTDDAMRIIQILAQNNFSLTPEYSTLLGKYYYKIKNFNLSVKNYLQAIRRNPMNDENYFLLASIYLEARKYNEAKKYLTQAIELDPTNVNYRSAYGQILYELSSADTAIGYLRDFLENNKENPKILGDIAVYYYRSGQVKAFERYKKIVEELPNRDESFYEFLIRTATLEDNMGNFLKYSEELLKINPGKLEARMKLGENYLTLKRYRDAIRMFESIKERLASYPRVHYHLAMVYIEMKDLNKALEHAQEEVGRNPTIEMGYYALGETYRRMENGSEATKALERSIAINPRYIPALISLASVKFSQGHLEPARELYLRALRENPSMPQVHRDLGFVHRGLGAGGLAIESFNTYLSLLPNAPDKPQIEAMIRQLR